MFNYSLYATRLWWLSAAISPLFGEEITADLRNPKYINGALFTNEGGVVRGSDLRIQAKSLQYTHRKEKSLVHRLEAEGNLMIQYKGHVFVGSELTYDFTTKRGVLYNGETFASPWYLGGEEIQIEPDGSYQVTDAFFTTCENKNSSWDLHAGHVQVLQDGLLQADRVRIRLFKMPIFALPSFKVNIKKFKEPIFRYSVNWDKAQGPRISARYQFYSWRTAALYGRLEYRVGTGFGGAFESEYCSQDKRTTFVTRSYLGSDRLETAPDKERRYRLQGALHSITESGKTRTELTWDKYSDVRMPADFPSEDFEVNTAKRTLFSVEHREKNAFVSLLARPRVNPFESLKQDLPTLFFSLRPLSLGASGILLDFVSKASYLNFTYSDRLIESIAGLKSIRLEMRPLFYRPLHFGPLILTPRLGAVGILYSNSPSHEQKNLGALLYGASLSAQASRTFGTMRHLLQPYVHYEGISSPTVSPDAHYIFSIQDGYHRLNQLQFGLRSCLSSTSSLFTADLYANFFVNTPAFHPSFYKLYLLLHWQFPSLEFSLFNIWNVGHRTIDRSNALLRWTLNENCAFTIEAIYRSQFDWRKADEENFIVDVTRPEEILRSSPLSDQRVTLLFHAFFRLTPFWECHLQSHHGYVNKTPQNPYSRQPYNEFMIDLFTWISSSWKLRISYSHTEKDDRVTTGLSLIKK